MPSELAENANSEVVSCDRPMAEMVTKLRGNELRMCQILLHPYRVFFAKRYTEPETASRPNENST